ncbi:MAG: DUF5050 domain-containing protein [Clostridiales bacterium]|jgi:hypothetical protein|nr:DUF5050 domain-containing protein [Clostridiales bacterium]
MKRILLLVAALFFSLTLSSGASQADPGIAVYVDGQIAVMDVMPYISSGTTLVPIRFVSTELGASVTWKNSQAEISYEDNIIIMKENSQTVNVNGKEETLSIPVQMRNGRLFVPLRFISEHFGAQVDYDNYVINIDTGRISPYSKSCFAPIGSYRGDRVADKKEGIYTLEWDKKTESYYIAFTDKEVFSKTKLITDLETVYNINVVGQYIYYDEKTTDNEGNVVNLNLFRYDWQTKEIVPMAEKAYRAYMTGDAIYYMDTPYYQGGLWRMDLDGGNKKQLAKDVTCYIVVGEIIYYASFSSDWKIFRMTIDGNNSKKLTNLSVFSSYSNGYFYGTSSEGNSDSILFRMKEDGSEKSRILTLEDNVRFSKVKVVGNWIYYTTWYSINGNGATGPLYRVSLDGQQKEQLTQEKALDFYLFQGGFCYTGNNAEFVFKKVD